MRLRGVAVVLAGIAALSLPATAPAEPLGDTRISDAGTGRGRALSCGTPPAIAFQTPRPWIAGASYDPARRPVVDGSVRWPAAALSLRTRPKTLVFAGAGQPHRTPTGVFPPGAGDDAAPFADGAAALAARALTGSFSRVPALARKPACVDPAVPVAVGLDGVPILPAFDPSGLDAVAREVVDSCGGRTDAAGLYYRRLPRCGAAAPRSGRTHSSLVGYARYGHPLYGPRGPGGKALRSRDLDGCHGHRHRVTLNGRRSAAYHYHLTRDFPHTLGCFRGTPTRSWRIAPPPPPSGDPGGGPPAPGDQPPAGDPPPAPDSELPSLAMDPPMSPAFDPDESDYVIRCQPETPVRVSVSAPDGTTVSVDGALPRGGEFTKNVDLDVNEDLRVRARTANGREVTYHTRCLPGAFPSFTVERFGVPQSQAYLLTPGSDPNPRYVIMLDSRGVPVWWFPAEGPPIDASVLPNGNVAWFHYLGGSFGIDFSSGYEERTLTGKLVRELRTVGSPTDLHDLKMLPNGNYLLLTYPPRDHVDLSPYGGPADATVVDSEVQELEPDGDLVWSWNSKDHVSLDETGRWWPTVIAAPTQLKDGRTAYDHVHINSVEPDGDGLIISTRQTDSLYRILRPSGAIDWKLGGTDTPERLDMVGDPFGETNFGGQHDARREPDGTVALYDNGTGRNRPPRGVRYRLDLVARTATLLEDIRDPQAPGSFCCGSSRKLDAGNWVSGWGGLSMFSEQTPAGDVVLRVRYQDGFSYRTIPIEPGTFSMQELRDAMDTMQPR